MDYELIIKSILDENVVNIKLISDTSNKVYRIILNNGETLYAKFYENNSTHIDHELEVYGLVDNKYLKEICYICDYPRMAIFKELAGKTVDSLSDYELKINANKIVSSLCEYFNCIASNRVEGYGLLNDKLQGQYGDFHQFLRERQGNTSEVLKDYKELSGIADRIFQRYEHIMYSDNSLVPIDTNLKNIMLLDDGNIKFVDPGEMISGPILMGYGDFVAHTYSTSLCDELMKKLELNEGQQKLVRIYAIFSSLNILAFLKKNGVNELDKIVPYGNKYTFYELINEHLKFLDI